MKWDQIFKTALQKEDITTIDKLLYKIPDFDNIEDMREAYSLIGKAKERFESKQLMIQQRMNELQYQKAS